MTETEELISRRDALKEALKEARHDVAAREDERTFALAELETQRAALAAEVAVLQAEFDSLETNLAELNEDWGRTTKEAAGARAHLEELTKV